MRIYLAIIAVVAIIGCGNNASIEFGMNDVTLLEGAAGDLGMRVVSIEVPDGNEYVPVWEGAEPIIVELETSDFTSITHRHIDVAPGTYSSVRLTIDSLTYIQQTSSTLVFDSSYQFVAQAFTPVVISDGDELRLVVSIAAEIWFDTDSVRIIEGHYPFEGAAMTVFYEY
jgi:hypothetical protein